MLDVRARFAQVFDIKLSAYLDIMKSEQSVRKTLRCMFLDRPRTGIACPLENAELEFDIKLSTYLDIMQTEQSATESL